MQAGVRLGLAALALLALPGTAARAQERVTIEQPPPKSISDLEPVMRITFAEQGVRERITDLLRDSVSGAPEVLRNASIRANLRTAYFRSDQSDGSTQQSWALGGWLAVESGELWDRLALGATGFTSLPVYAPPDQGGSQLLKPNQDSYSVVGELYARLRITDELTASAYRQELNSPFINRGDARISPNTFEFYGAVGGHRDDAGGQLDYGGGWVASMRMNASERFVSMARAAGASASRGVALAGASYSWPHFSIGAIDYYSADILNIGYAEASVSHTFENKLGVRGAVQLTDQRSTGSELLTGSAFAVNQVGVSLALSRAGGVLTLAYTNTTSGASLQGPWGSVPGYTSVQVANFDRAGEQAFLVKASYELTALRLPGVGVRALWTHGWGVVPGLGPNLDEYDLELRWHPARLGGLWFRAAMAMVNDRGGSHASLDDYRLIVNYDFAAL